MRFRVNQIVAVSFLDHSEGSEHCEFTIWGRVSGVTRTTVTVRSWDYFDEPGGDDDANIVAHTIIKRAITKAVELRERKQ